MKTAGRLLIQFYAVTRFYFITSHHLQNLVRYYQPSGLGLRVMLHLLKAVKSSLQSTNKEVADMRESMARIHDDTENLKNSTLSGISHASFIAR